MAFKVLNSGIFTTIQDQGRYGYAHLGITNSGAMDEYAYLWSQTLLGQKNINALEVMVGLKLEATKDIEISITGADLDFKIDGNSLAIWQTHYIKKGSILSFNRRVYGQRAYLAIKGGFDVPKKYGSYSTTLKEGIGFRLRRGDSLISCSGLKPPIPKSNPIFRVQPKYIPDYEKPLTLRVVLGYQEAEFTAEEREKFFNSEYEITLQSDRMGFRLKGEPIKANIDGIISEGIAFGSIQIPQDGQPIVLLKERQTIGGYPKIGTVLAEDCFRLAQRGAGCGIRFKEVDWELFQ
jgi:biotin-dependent carboxylase-like uncharacterized protein